MNLQTTTPKIDEDVVILTPNFNFQSVVVAAPADLEAGYTFDASINGKIFSVTVPAGGVKMGENIMVNIPETLDKIPIATEVSVAQPSADTALPAFSSLNSEEGMTSNPIVADPSAAIPIGRWREGFCECFEHGCAEPTCCLAFWCNGMALGQVMTRLKLNAVAEPTANFSKTFAIVSAVWIGYTVINWMLSILTRSTNTVCIYYSCYYYVQIGFTGFTWFLAIVALLLAIYFIYIGTATRMRMRNAFQIAGSCFGDCCACFWCPCCTVTQMARHTHDYHVHKSACCSKNGLRTGAPDIV